MWLHPHKNRPFNATSHARNEAMKEHDHATLGAAITAIVRETGHKILIGHEDITEIPIGREWLLDLLPADVKPSVVWRETPWLTDEALGIYTRSAGLFGHEMHSPTMCIGQGIPALVGRSTEQSSKGLMRRDLGLDDWLFDTDDPADVTRLVPAALAFAQDPVAAKARALVATFHRDTMAILARQLP